MNTEHGGNGLQDQAPVWPDPNNLGENIYEEQARLWAQAQARRQQDMGNARVRQLHEQDHDAIRRQNAQRAQLIEVRRRQIQLEQDEIRRRQLQNDEDEARRRRVNEAARARATPSTRDGNWCIVM